MHVGVHLYVSGMDLWIFVGSRMKTKECLSLQFGIPCRHAPNVISLLGISFADASGKGKMMLARSHPESGCRESAWFPIRGPKDGLSEDKTMPAKTKGELDSRTHQKPLQNRCQNDSKNPYKGIWHHFE